MGGSSTERDKYLIRGLIPTVIPRLAPCMCPARKGIAVGAPILARDLADPDLFSVAGPSRVGLFGAGPRLGFSARVLE